MRLLRSIPLCRAIGDRTRGSLREAADFLFPAACPLCASAEPEAFRDVDGSSSVFCDDCQRLLGPPIAYGCSRCGAEVGPFSSTVDGCVHCRRKTLHFDSVICLGMYRDQLKQALLHAKWSFSSVNMESLAALLWRNQASALRQLNIDCIIPVPQHWQQRLTRHFNPAWIVADLLRSRLSVVCDVHILRRNRRTRPQKRVSVSPVSYTHLTLPTSDLV